jgi:hypothetical protein
MININNKILFLFKHNFYILKLLIELSLIDFMTACTIFFCKHAKKKFIVFTRYMKYDK